MNKGWIKISKRDWAALGGLTNRDLFTRQSPRGAKTYYKIIRHW